MVAFGAYTFRSTSGEVTLLDLSSRGWFRLHPPGLDGPFTTLELAEHHELCEPTTVGKETLRLIGGESHRVRCGR